MTGINSVTIFASVTTVSVVGAEDEAVVEVSVKVVAGTVAEEVSEVDEEVLVVVSDEAEVVVEVWLCPFGAFPDFP